jgi:hypothetical protein
VTLERRRRLAPLLLVAGLACSGGDDPRAGDFDCAGGRPGWIRAQAITPDAVPPCRTGSAGICPESYTYVAGTGFCRPK